MDYLKVLSVAAASSVLLVACGGGAAPAATTAPGAATAKPAAASAITVRVYSSLPLTGNSASQTSTIVNAIKLALTQQTKDGAVCNGSVKIDYQSLDDATAAKGQWDEAQEQANANKAVGDTDSVAYIGTFNSGAAKISIPILNQANPGPLTMISMANTNVGLTKAFNPGEPDKYYPTGKRNYSRVVANDTLQGSFGAKWMAKLGAKKVVVVDDGEVYGKGLADIFVKTTKDVGIEVLSREQIKANEGDYKAIANKIAALKPDGVYFGGITGKGTTSLFKELNAVIPDAFKMGGDGINENDFAADSNNKGVYATTAGVPRSKLGEKGKKFYTDYKAAYNADPEVYAIYGYDAASIVINAINTVCKADRSAINDKVFGTKDFDGAIGKFSFDKDGDVTLDSMVGYQAVNGKYGEVPADRLP